MRAALLLAICASMHAASFGVSIPVHSVAHPIRSFHSVSGDRALRMMSVVFLESVNYADYETTYRGVIHGPYCEQNALFRLPGCRINAPRFTGVKIAVAAFGVAQEIPEFFPAFRASKWRGTYERSFLIVNLGVSVPLGIAVANNVRVLRSGK